MTKDQMTKLMSHLTWLATEAGMFGEGAGPFTIEFGYVDSSNTVKHDGVRLLEAAPFVLTNLVKWAESQQPKVFTHVTNGAVLFS